MAKYQLSKEEIKQLQRLIGAEEDGLWGPKSKAALNEYTLSQFEPMTEPSTAEYNPLFNTGRLPVKVDKPVADYREDKDPINYMDALLALKNLESNKPMPRVPSSWVGWASYINSGDRGLLSEFAEADKAWNMKKLEEEEKARQLISNIREKELDRKNAKEISKQNVNTQQADKDALIQKEYDFAQIELDAAKDKLDVDNPDSVAALKKAVKKANYWGKQLPADYGFELEILPDDASLVDSKSVRIKKKVDKANALLSREGTNWKDEHWKEASALSEDLEIPEVTRLQLAAKVANKGEGAETKAKNWAERKKQLLDKYNKMNPNQKRVWKKNNPKTAKAIGV